MPISLSWPLALPPSTPVTPGIATAPAFLTRTAPSIREREGLPRRGLRIPLGVDERGRGATVKDLDQDYKIIGTALGSNDNNNAFQLDPGLGEEMVFELSDPVVQGKILVRLRQVFADFALQKRYKLLDNSIKWTERPEEQELELSFKFHNLETDEVKDYKRSYREGS